MPVQELPFETASWARRVLALLVDYAACWGVMLAVYGSDWFGSGSLPSVYLNLLFIAESALLMALSGGSFGQLATRLRVVRVDGSGRPLSLLTALLRQVMICLVIPPLVFRPDGRGLHDMVCGSATVPLVPRTDTGS
ncbi:MAG TPA: RDD family protein [Nocardioides sp.]|uniref:RDD family protein n=1 Tax=Nocardioides sp. TaxID=35761 RepID=UPI002F40308E